MNQITQLQPRITLNIKIDLEPGSVVVEDVRRAVELAAVEAIEAAREKVRELTSARIATYHMRSSVSIIPLSSDNHASRVSTNCN